MDQTLSLSNVEPLVSIIMPAYNAAKYIGETIDSVLAQTYEHWELIIVDDGSTDTTHAIITAYMQKDVRIRYIYQENARQSRARNNGISNSNGIYVAFLDSDDLWLPEKLSLQLQFIRENGADLVFADAYVFEQSFSLVDTARVLGAGKGKFSGQAGLVVFLEQNQIPTLTVMATRAALAKVGNFTEDARFPYAEDYHLWLKMLLAGCVLEGQDAVLGAYREHSESSSSSDRLCLPYVVEAKANLLQLYPEQSAVLAPSIKLSILRNLDVITKERKESDNVYTIIDRYLNIGDKRLYQPLFTIIHKLGIRRLAIRGIYFVFNHL